MAELFDKATPAVKKPAIGAGNRLGHVLEETKPVWMGRMRPIPGDTRFKPYELEQVRAALKAALDIIDRVSGVTAHEPRPQTPRQ